MRILNNKLIRTVQKMFNLKDDSIDEASDIIVPVVNVEPYNEVCLAGGGDASGTLTTTLDVTKGDFILTGFHVMLVKDVACDCAETFITIPSRTGNQVAFVVGMLTAAAVSQTLGMYIPLKTIIPAGSVITWNGTYAAGNMRRRVTFYGYYEG